MKKLSKKYISLLLSIVLIFSSVPPIFALAEVRNHAMVAQGTSGDTVVFPTAPSEEISKCEYLFSSTSAGVGTFRNSETGTDIYLTIDKNGTSGCPGSTQAETLQIAANSGFVKKNTFYIKNSTASRYLFFWDDNGTRKYRFDRQGSLSTYSQCYFALFTPDEGNTTSGIYGYKRVTSVSEIVNGKKYLIAHASAYNDNGSLAQGASWYVAYPSTSSNPYQHVAKVTNVTEDVSKKHLNVTGYGTVVMSGGTNRTNGTSLCIVNDGESEDFDLGFINVDVSSINISKETVTDASLDYSVTVPSNCENMGISVYYATKNLSSLEGTGANVGGNGNIYGFGNDRMHQDFAINYYGLKYISSVSPSTGASNVNYSVDLTEAINTVRAMGKTKLSVVFMNTTPGQSGNAGGWTDTYVNVTSTRASYESEEFVAPDSFKEAFGLIEYDPVIYTMGEDYLQNGEIIAHGGEQNERQTGFKVKEGYTICSITSEQSRDFINPSTRTGEGILYGRVAGVNENTSKPLTITTKLMDEQGNGFVQKDRLYVFSNPVPSHASGGAYSYKIAIGSSYYSDYVGFNLVAEDSIPAYNTAISYDDDVCRRGNAIKYGLTTARYSSQTFGDNYDATKSFNVTSEKAAGGFEYFKSNASHAIVRVNAPKASYYFDKSVSDNPGIHKEPTGAYYLSMTYLPQNVYDAGRNTPIEYTNFSEKNTDFGVGITISGSRTPRTGDKTTYKISINNFEDGTHTGIFAIKESAMIIPGAYLTLYIPFSLKIYDKSSLRDIYKSYINMNLDCDQFTTDSWNNFCSKMLNAQEYLNMFDYYDEVAQENLVDALTKAFTDLKCEVVLNYQNGTTKTVELGYLSNIPRQPTVYGESTDPEKHIRTESTWLPAAVSGKMSADENLTAIEENHQWDEGVVLKAATCTEDGSIFYSCPCGLTKTETITKTGHKSGPLQEENYVAGTCISKGSYDRVRRCTVCDIVMYTDHKTTTLGDHSYEISPISTTEHLLHCSICENDQTQAHTFVDGACTVCNYILLDEEAFNKAVEEYEAITSDDEYEQRYTMESRATYEILVSMQRSIKFTRQSEIDDATSRILAAKSTLALNTVNVNYSIYDENGDLLEARQLAHGYGNVLELTTLTPAKWVTTLSGEDTLVSASSTLFSSVLKNELNIYSINLAIRNNDKTKVSYFGKGSRTVCIQYVDSIDALDTTSVDAPNVPFYTFSSWSTPELQEDGSYIVYAQYSAKI